ncbi:MAG TPA: YggS family pyridoxal phosphate-dependent enzyme [Terriglobales bacterium]|nr:YggS family pyridoxal phosphate-dependent enzyme [Terriglobales bacterium]
MSLVERTAEIRQKIAVAAQKSGRDPDDIALMAVTKTFGPKDIRESYEAGLRLFGENRVQEFAGKVNELVDLTDAEWHMIGHLQSNKANKAVELFSGVDSVDSVRLAEKLNAAANERGKKLKILVEVNVGGEAAKSGVDPDSQEFWKLLESAPSWAQLEIQGLMTVPPFTEDPEGARPYFRRLRELRDQIAGRQFPAVNMDVLSMGMSHDFEVAIEEGSTCVRVGTAIFGSRPTPQKT